MYQNVLYLFSQQYHNKQYQKTNKNENDFPLLLIWRETSTQHFDTIYGDGHYFKSPTKSNKNISKSKQSLCVPITNYSSNGVPGAPYTRMPIMKNI